MEFKTPCKVRVNLKLSKFLDLLFCQTLQDKPAALVGYTDGSYSYRLLGQLRQCFSCMAYLRSVVDCRVINNGDFLVKSFLKQMSMLLFCYSSSRSGVSSF